MIRKEKASGKQILCGFGVVIDAVAGWLCSYGDDDFPSDIQRGMFAGEVGSSMLLKLFDTFKLGSWRVRAIRSRPSRANRDDCNRARIAPHIKAANTEKFQMRGRRVCNGGR